MAQSVDGDSVRYLPPFALIRRCIETASERLRVRRMVPSRIHERWYRVQHPDAADSIRPGFVEAAQAHLERDGYRQGRLSLGI